MLQVIQSALRHFGIFNGCLYLFNQLSKKMFGDGVILEKFYIYAQPLTQEKILPVKKAGKYKLINLKRESTDLRIFGRPTKVIEDRYDKGGQCIGCFKNDKLLGYIWFTFESYNEDVVRCVYIPYPKETTCWDYDIFIEPKYRIGFVFAALWDALNEELYSKGYRWSMSRISAFAVESIKSQSRLGAKRIGMLIFLKLFGSQLLFSSNSPYVHLSFSEKNYPHLVVRFPDKKSI